MFDGYWQTKLQRNQFHMAIDVYDNPPSTPAKKTTYAWANLQIFSEVWPKPLHEERGLTKCELNGMQQSFPREFMRVPKIKINK